MQPVDQPTSKPTPKVAAVGTAGVVMTLVVAVAGVFNIHLPASLGDNVTSLVTGVVAFVSIVHFLVGYFKRDNIQLTTAPPAVPTAIPVSTPDTPAS